MLALGLCIVLGGAVERRVAGPEEFPNVAGQELHLLGDDSQGVNDGHVAFGTVDGIGHNVAGNGDCGGPC